LNAERLCLLSFLAQLPAAAAYVATKYFDTRNDTTNFRVLGRRGNTKFRLFLGGAEENKTDGFETRRVRSTTTTDETALAAVSVKRRERRERKTC
jgi:hypothetical protein